MPHIHFGARLVNAIWDEAAQLYHIDIEHTSADGGTRIETVDAAILISAVGGLHVPKMPDIKGIDRFVGSKFHSTAWNHDVDLKNKTVGIIGNGCTAYVSCGPSPRFYSDTPS